MTTTLELVLAHLDREALDAFDTTARRQVERVILLVQQFGAAAFVYAGDGIFPRPEDAAAAIIPAGLARELIAEGRLKWPLYTSMTVTAAAQAKPLRRDDRSRGA